MTQSIKVMTIFSLMTAFVFIYSKHNIV